MVDGNWLIFVYNTCLEMNQGTKRQMQPDKRVPTKKLCSFRPLKWY